MSIEISFFSDSNYGITIVIKRSQFINFSFDASAQQILLLLKHEIVVENASNYE
jgi:hypothetical protein